MMKAIAKQKKRRMAHRREKLFYHGMLFIPVVLLFIYHFLPIPAGILMSFQNFQPGKGFFGSRLVGLDNFQKLLILPDTFPALRNTLIIAVEKIICNLIIPILFALLLNEVRVKWFKRAVQTITYLPYFLSWVILAGILIKFLSPGSSAASPGFFNTLLMNLGILDEPVYFLGNNDTFRQTMVITDVWKNFGYKTIVYLAALTGIDPTLYEASAVDGAGRLKQTFYITLPAGM